MTLTIGGAGFVPAQDHGGTRAIWKANTVETLLTTTFDSATQIRATVPAAMLRDPVAAQIAVQTGDIQGASNPRSNFVSFAVAPSPPVPVSAGLSGNWSGRLVADMGPGHSVDAPISGPLSEANGSVATTALRLDSTMCFAAVLVRSGTLKGSTVSLDMTAADFAGIQFSGTLAGDQLSGRFRIDGSECGSGTGTLTMTRIPAITGTWTGTLRSNVTGFESPVTLSVTQTSTIITNNTNTSPFGISSLKVNAVIQQAGTGCILEVATAVPALTGTIAGTSLNLQSNGSPGIALNGAVNLSSTSMAGTYNFVGTSCNGETGTFTFNRT